MMWVSAVRFRGEIMAMGPRVQGCWSRQLWFDVGLTSLFKGPYSLLHLVEPIVQLPELLSHGPHQSLKIRVQGGTWLGL